MSMRQWDALEMVCMEWSLEAVPCKLGLLMAMIQLQDPILRQRSGESVQA